MTHVTNKPMSGLPNAEAVTHESRITKRGTPKLWVRILVVLAALASSSQMPASTPKIKFPDLSLIVQRLEDVQKENPARSRPYQVTREYKVFRGDDKQPTSEITTQIDFVPPDTKTYKITQTRGNSRGEKMVREILDRETESAKKGPGSEINRANYEFLFVGQENFGDVPEYILRIVPKRKDKYLLRGQIWVNATTFRIRRIEGVPAKSPSIWLKGIHITLQFAQLGAMWIPNSFDAIATVRLLGRYTLAGHNVRASDALSGRNRGDGRLRTESSACAKLNSFQSLKDALCQT
jgi:hypothetical protein